MPLLRVPLLAAVLLVLGLQTSPVAAQFGMVTLPQDDFVWNWGDVERRRGIEDFSVAGNEGRFRCELAGAFGPGSRLTSADARQLENELRSSLFFIQAAAQAMYVLDSRRDLDWATLDCQEPEPTEASEAERAERLERARERALREQAQRRERERRQEDRAND
jgi:hypothetical protein